MKVQPKKPDSQLQRLYEHALRGEEAARAQLFGHLAARFRCIAGYRIRDPDDAEEASQEALSTVLAKYRDVELKGEFAGWAYKVLDFKIRKSIESRMRQRRREPMLLDTEDGLVGSQPPAETEKKLDLLNCLERLHEWNSRYARVVVLASRGYKAPEISKSLGVSTATLYVLLSRARARLRQCLETGEIQ